MKLTSLENYIKENIKVSKENYYYNESFCNLTSEYLGMKGYEINQEDEEFLDSEGYSIDNFMDDYEEDEEDIEE